MLDTVDPPIQQPKWKELTDLEVSPVSSVGCRSMCDIIDDLNKMKACSA